MQMRLRLALVLAPAFSGACIPYTAATTAAPIPVGEMRRSMVYFVTPFTDFGDSTSPPRMRPSMDIDVRYGLTDRSDVGVRVPSASGIVVNYKRLLSDTAAPVRIAIMPGLGFVNMFEHAHGELSVLVSGRDDPIPGGLRQRPAPRFTPYGGLRVMHVAPLHPRAVHDRPTAGAFLGVRIHDGVLNVSPEVGVFHDPSALGLRRGALIVVPAVTVHRDRDRNEPPRGRPGPRPRSPPPVSIPRPRR